MVKNIDPSDIGKHPEAIKKAQQEIMQTDVLVCGKCYSVFNFIELFNEHKEKGCESESKLKELQQRETKPKVWAFLLWKASQNSPETCARTSWQLYQTWMKQEENIRETWNVAGRTIQSFAKMGMGPLHEMPVKITKTVPDDSSPTTSPDTKLVTSSKPGTFTVNKLTQRGIEVRQVAKSIVKKEIEETTEDESKDDIKMIPTQQNQQRNQMSKITLKTSIKGAASENIGIRSTNTKERGLESKPHKVEKILAKRFNPRKNMYEYFVKWIDDVANPNTWEPADHLKGCALLLEAFETQLARQKEQRALLAARIKREQEQELQQPITVSAATLADKGQVITSSLQNRPARNSKARAVDQVKQWAAEDEDSGGAMNVAVKRRAEDSDYDGGNESDEDESNHPDKKKIRNEFSPTQSGGGVRLVQVSKQSPSSGRMVNGVATAIKDTARNGSAEIVITSKDNKSTGIVRKAGIKVEQKSEAQVRVLSKTDTIASGIVRAGTTPPSKQQIVTQVRSGVVQMKPTTIQQTTIRSPVVITPKQVVRQLTPTQAVVQKPLTKPNMRPNVQQVSRISLSPNRAGNSPKAMVSRVIRSAPTSKQATPEQKMMNISRQNNLKVVRKQNSSNADITMIDDEEEDAVAMAASASPPPPMTLCPVTGEVLGIAEGEPAPSTNPEPEQQTIKKEPIIKQHQIVVKQNSAQQVKKNIVAKKSPSVQQQMMAQKQKMTEVRNAEALKNQQIQQQQQQHEQQQAATTSQQQHSDQSFSIQGEDGQVQQFLSNDDGTPLMVSGDDGTIYQVAGKNEHGQTVLIAQGADGEQQCLLVTSDEPGERNDVLTLDTAVAEAVAQMIPEQSDANEDTELTQPLSITTGDSDSQDGQITAEIVQAELPSPGGTRKVVLLLPDGSLMMTEVSDEEYQALNLNT